MAVFVMFCLPLHAATIDPVGAAYFENKVNGTTFGPTSSLGDVSNVGLSMSTSGNNATVSYFSIFEFDIAGIEPNSSVTLNLLSGDPLNGACFNLNPCTKNKLESVNLWGYSGDGVVDSLDLVRLRAQKAENPFENPDGTLAAFSLAPIGESASIDVSPFLLGLLGNSQHAGFIVEAAAEGFDFLIASLTHKSSLPASDLNGNLSAVPIPGAVWLFGSALLGLYGFGRRRKSLAS